MSSRICTVIFLFDSDGPVSRTSLRLNVSPPSSRKNVEEQHHDRLAQGADHAHGARQQKVASLNPGGSTTTCVAACLGTGPRRPPASSPSRPRRRRSASSAGCRRIGAQSRQRGREELAARLGELLDDRLHLPAQRIGAECRARSPRPASRRSWPRGVESAIRSSHDDQRIQRVREQNPEQQRNEERLRDIERCQDGERGKDRQRQAAHIQRNPNRRRRRGRFRHDFRRCVRRRNDPGIAFVDAVRGGMRGSRMAGATLPARAPGRG